MHVDDQSLIAYLESEFKKIEAAKHDLKLSCWVKACRAERLPTFVDKEVSMMLVFSYCCLEISMTRACFVGCCFKQNCTPLLLYHCTASSDGQSFLRN